MEICSTAPPILDQLRSEIDSVIADLRPLLVPLSVEKVAIRLRLQIDEHHFRGPVRGATVGERLVLLDQRLQGTRRAQVFAHEVAHVLQRRGHFAAVYAEDVELFADQFARELLVPRAWLLPMREPAPILARRLGVGQALVAMQLGAAGVVPAVLRDRSKVLCASCGDIMRNRSCGCRRFREDRRLRGRLDDMRALPGFERLDTGQMTFLDSAAGGNRAVVDSQWS